MTTTTVDSIIEATAEKAGGDWRSKALETVERLALERKVFTSDDVWLAGLERPENSRALGQVMRQAAKQGHIEPTDRLENSVFESGHFGPRRVWRSLVHVLPSRA